MVDEDEDEEGEEEGEWEEIARDSVEAIMIP